MVGMMCVPFDAGDRTLRPRQRTVRRRWLASINTPLFRGLGNFAAQRSRGMARRAKGKFLLNGVVAKRQGPRRQVARQERLQWGKAVSPNGTHAKNVRFENATVAGRNLRREQGRGVASQGEAVWRMRISASGTAGLLSL